MRVLSCSPATPRPSPARLVERVPTLAVALIVAAVAGPWWGDHAAAEPISPVAVPFASGPVAKGVRS